MTQWRALVSTMNASPSVGDDEAVVVPGSESRNVDGVSALPVALQQLDDYL